MYHLYIVIIISYPKQVPTISIPSIDGVEQHKWPRAGETNCSFKVKIVKIAVPLSCCATIDDSNEPKNIDNLSQDNVNINDYELKQSIYSSYPWIEYIVRAGWTSRSNECWIQYLDRDQQKTNLVLYEMDKYFTLSTNNYNQDQDGDEKMQEKDSKLCGQQLLYQAGTPWINIHDSYMFIKDGLLWVAEHTGFKHLYFIPYPKEYQDIEIQEIEKKSSPQEVNMIFATPTQCEVQQLTSGKWNVADQGFAFDKNTNTIYFNGRRETHLEQHLYSIQFDPLKPANEYKVTLLTPSGFFHSPKVDSIHFKYFTSIYSAISKPRQFAIYSIDGQCIKEFSVPYRGHPDKLQYVEPQIIEIENFPSDATEEQKKNADFKDLYTFSAVIYPPFDEEYQKTKQYKKGGYPTIIYVYGGPLVQLITNSWDRMTGNARIQLWRTLGFTVATIDSRGSNHRGLAFEGRIKYKMGQIEIQDQVKLVEHLVKEGLTDKANVGIAGYSYGGYMSLMAMCQRPDIFKTCVSGAPVTMWQLYDTGYTERYMGTPEQQKEAYDDGSVLKYVDNFPDQENRVVIIHGVQDENVHFYHTSKLIEAMIKANKPYDLKIFPGERHGIRKWDNLVYMEKFYVSHFKKMLQP